MKVLITGAAGYIGRHVVKECISRGFDVIVNDLNFKGIDEQVIFNSSNIFADDDNLFEKLGAPDCIIHMAWKDGFIHNSDAHMKELSKHYLFLKRMIDSGVKNISIMGSMHEVGYWEGAIDENTPCNPQTMYGISKNALRQSILLYAKDKNTKVKWLRAYYIFGDDYRGSSIFAKITQAALEGKKTFPFTTGKNKYDFIRVDELSKRIVLASISDKYDGIINVCTGEPKSLAEQIEWYIKENKFDIKLEYGKFPDRPYDSPGVWGDPTIINNILDEN